METSRRRFLKNGAALAGLAAAAGIRPAEVQGGGQSFLDRLPPAPDPRQRADFVPDERVPMDHAWRDPWTGEPMRDDAGELVVDWTGTPQWEAYRKNIRAAGGPRYGKVAVDSRLYGVRSRFETAHRLGSDGGQASMTAPNTAKVNFPSLGTPLETQMGVITPSGLHFVDEHGDVPEVDPRQHKLTLFGMVDRPMTWTMEQLMNLPSVSRIHFLHCNTNATTGYRNAIQPWATAGRRFMEGSCSEWTGVLLSTLMEIAGVQKGARWFFAGAADEYNQTWAIPMWKALDDAMVAYGQNGEAVRPEQGYPVRLLVPGFQGTMNIKRLRRIKVTDEITYFHRRYTETFPDDKMTWFRFEHTPNSCVLKPSGGMTVPKGPYELRGVAWSGGGKVTKVEVTVDGGKTWKEAQIQGPVYPKAHTRFVFPWNWNGEETIVASRCTDERGSYQPTTEQWAKLYSVDMDTVKVKGYPRFNAPQCWKIARDGKVTNAIFSI